MAAAAIFGACSDGTTGPGTGTPGVDDGIPPRATLSFASRAATTPAAAPAFSYASAFGDTITSGGNTLIIDRVRIVLEEIELERQEVVDCDVEPEPAGCEDFEIGPIIIDVPLGGGAQHQLEITIDPGTYDEIEFEIHKLEGSDSADAAFIALNPEFDGISIKVEGTYNGQAFTFTSDLGVEQEVQLNPPMIIADSTTSSNVTIKVDVATWFRDAAGALIDPDTGNKNGTNESIVKENIKRSFKAFKDDDEDGEENDSDDDDDDLDGDD